jgi:RNA recognition motif
MDMYNMGNNGVSSDPKPQTIHYNNHYGAMQLRRGQLLPATVRNGEPSNGTAPLNGQMNSFEGAAFYNRQMNNRHEPRSIRLSGLVEGDDFQEGTPTGPKETSNADRDERLRQILSSNTLNFAGQGMQVAGPSEPQSNGIVERKKTPYYPSRASFDDDALLYNVRPHPGGGLVTHYPVDYKGKGKMVDRGVQQSNAMAGPSKNILDPAYLSHAYHDQLNNGFAANDAKVQIGGQKSSQAEPRSNGIAQTNMDYMTGRMEGMSLSSSESFHTSSYNHNAHQANLPRLQMHPHRSRSNAGMQHEHGGMNRMNQGLGTYRNPKSNGHLGSNSALSIPQQVPNQGVYDSIPTETPRPRRLEYELAPRDFNPQADPKARARLVNGVEWINYFWDERKQKFESIHPDAIVIKNITFAILQVQLKDLINRLGLPEPFAFNYHFDKQDAFRGMAFANFNSHEDAKKVLRGLQGVRLRLEPDDPDNPRDPNIEYRELHVEFKVVQDQKEKEMNDMKKRAQRGQLRAQHQSVTREQMESLLPPVNMSTTSGPSQHTRQPDLQSQTRFDAPIPSRQSSATTFITTPPSGTQPPFPPCSTLDSP